MEWVTFCRRTNDPKLSYIEASLTTMSIPHRRNGESFHAPILEVPDYLLVLAASWLAQPFDDDNPSLDDMPDDDPIFHDMLDSGEFDKWAWLGQPSPHDLDPEPDAYEGYEYMTHPCIACGTPLSDEFHYALCTPCQETAHCPHGNLYKDGCSRCDSDSDFAYDAWRERR